MILSATQGQWLMLAFTSTVYPRLSGFETGPKRGGVIVLNVAVTAKPWLLAEGVRLVCYLE